MDLLYLFDKNVYKFFNANAVIMPVLIKIGILNIINKCHNNARIEICEHTTGLFYMPLYY
jgi:hypothetical protein